MFDTRSHESYECCKAIKDLIEVKTTDKNKKEVGMRRMEEDFTGNISF